MNIDPYATINAAYDTSCAFAKTAANVTCAAANATGKAISSVANATLTASRPVINKGLDIASITVLLIAGTGLDIVSGMAGLTKIVAGSIEQGATNLSSKISANSKKIVPVTTAPMYLNTSTFEMVNIMIDRGAGRCRIDDADRASYISQKPNFINEVSSIDTLRSIAHSRYSKNENKDKIMETIENSFNDTDFKTTLNNATNELQSAVDQKDEIALQNAEAELRVVLEVFNQAEQLQHFHRSEYANME